MLNDISELRALGVQLLILFGVYVLRAEAQALGFAKVRVVRRYGTGEVQTL